VTDHVDRANVFAFAVYSIEIDKPSKCRWNHNKVLKPVEEGIEKHFTFQKVVNIWNEE
jgi:hypothetical protein